MLQRFSLKGKPGSAQETPASEEYVHLDNNRAACASHQWSSSYTVEVIEETLCMVDGGTEDGVWFTPLTIQILTVQITAIPAETDGTFLLRELLFNLLSPTVFTVVILICFMILSV